MSCVAGNAHYSLGLINNPRGFDFVLPLAPDMPLQEGAEIIPYGLIRKHLLDMAHETIPALHKAARAPMAQLGSPPPTPPENVMRNPGHFAPLVRNLGLSRPERIWRF